jgi:hypothetical protein
VERALNAHHQRDYLLSIPPLFPQIEGIIADALILANEVADFEAGKMKATEGAI